MSTLNVVDPAVMSTELTAAVTPTSAGGVIDTNDDGPRDSGLLAFLVRS